MSISLHFLIGRVRAYLTKNRYLSLVIPVMVAFLLAFFVGSTLVSATEAEFDLPDLPIQQNVIAAAADCTAPCFTVSKTAVPQTINEGGTVTYTIQVDNLHATDAITLTNLDDSLAGTLPGTCAVPQIIIGNGNYVCSYTFTFSQPGTYPNTITATATISTAVSYNQIDTISVIVTDEQPTVSITKSANPITRPEPGGSFGFTLNITNTSVETVTISSLSDTQSGATNFAACADLVGTTVAAGASKTCSYTVNHANAGSYPNTASVTVTDDEGNTTDLVTASETVTVTDEQPTVSITKSANPITRPEPGGSFDFTLNITNTSVETVTISSLSDTQSGATNFAACADLVGTTVAAGASKTCSYTVNHANAGSYPNTASVTVTDDEGNTTNPITASQTVTVTDTLPIITVTKTVSPTVIPETGGDVVFTFEVENTVQEAVTLTTLIDNQLGNLNGQGSCATGSSFSIPYTCAITTTLSGDYSGPAHSNIVTATVSDNDGNSDTAADSAEVAFRDVKPAITVIKTNDADGDGIYSNIEQIPWETVGATFQVSITNDTLEAVTVTSIIDSIHGAGGTLTSAQSPDCASLVGSPLAGNSSVNCFFDGTINDTVPSETNTITVTVNDNEENSAVDSDDSTVLVPGLEIFKSPNSQMVLNGDDATFTIVITNTGGVPLTSVEVSDLEAPDCDRAFPSLPSGGQETYQCTAAAVHQDFTNTAEVSALDTLSKTITAKDTAFVDVINPRISIAKTPDTQAVPSGATVNFTIQVTNSGDVPLTNITVADAETDDCDRNNLGTFAAGQSTTYSCSHINATADFLNEATATGQHPLNGTVQDSDTAFVDVNNPDIAIYKNPDTQNIVKGGTATFNIAVINNGAVDLTNVTVFDAFTPDCNRTFGSLPAGQDHTYTCRATDVTADFVNIATASGTNPASGKQVTDSDIARVELIDMVVDITAQPSSLPEPGGLVKFVVTVINQGSKNVTLSQLDSTPFGELNDWSNSNVQNNSCAFGGSTASAGSIIAVDTPTSMTLTPTDDAYVRSKSDKMGNNYGSLDHIRLRNDDPDDDYNSYLKFNVTGLSGPLQSAILRLYVTDPSGSGGEVYSVSNNYLGGSTPWIENGLTWNNAPALNGAPLDSQEAVSTGQWVEFDVTAAVAGNGIYSFGLTNGSSDSVFYSSKEGDNSPELVITVGTSSPPIIEKNGGSYVCSFDAEVSSQPGDYPVSVTAVLDAGVAHVSDNTIVTLTDLPSSITLTTAPDPINVSAPEGSVLINLRIDNTSAADSVTITSLVDNRLGNLAGKGSCQLPQTIIPGSFYQCSYEIVVTGSTGQSQMYTITAAGMDDDDSSVNKNHQVTINIVTPPEYRILLPIVFNQYVYSEPNNVACAAYPLTIKTQYAFLADDVNDWYRFELPGSSNVVVELTNFTPLAGQLLVYSDNGNCSSLTNQNLIGHNGDFALTKIINLGQRPAGRYYIWVINDGPINTTNPYQLRVIIP